MKLKKDKKLEKIAGDVKYEIGMFRLTTEHLYYYSNKVSANEKVKDSHFLINILLESFAIHSYNLYKFFYQGEREKKNNRKINRKNSDVIAEDFLGTIELLNENLGLLKIKEINKLLI